MKIAVIGAGISGLSAAHFVKKIHPNANVTIFERTDRVGGNIRTEVHDGHVFEFGPRSFLGKSKELLEIIEDIDLWNDIEFADKSAKKRYIYKNNDLVEIPFGPKALFSNPIIKKPIRTLLKEWKSKPVNVYDSVKIFSDRHFGYDVTQYMVDPALSGIYAGNITKLSTNAVFPQLKKYEQEYGSVLKGMFKNRKNGVDSGKYSKNVMDVGKHTTYTIIGGLQRLAEQIIHKNEINVLFNQQIKSIKQTVDKSAEVRVGDAVYKYDKVIVTTPSYVSAHILRECDEEFYKALGLVKYAPIAVVNAAYEKKVLDISGFGYLVPQKERQKILGTVFNSNIFPSVSPNGETNLSIMLGGMNQSDIMEKSANEIVKTALSHVRRHLHIEEKPTLVKIRQYSRAIPQYNMGIEKVWARLDEVKEKYPSILLGGNYQYVISVGDSVAYSKKLAESIRV